MFSCLRSLNSADLVSTPKFREVTEEEEEGRKNGLNALKSDANETFEEREGVILTAPCQEGLTDNAAMGRDFVGC